MSTERVSDHPAWSNEGWCIDATSLTTSDELQVLRKHFDHFVRETKLSDTALVSFDLTMTVAGFRELLRKLA